jgi:predicted transcriptional regulator
MEALRVIEKVAGKITLGHAPSFIEAHVIKALEAISAGKAGGRTKLSQILGLGEGVTRILVRHLGNEGFIEVSKSGMVLSNFGEEVFSDLRSRISEEMEIPRSSLTLGSFNVAVLIRNAARSVKYGVEQRDAAIKIGALGAITLVFSCNKLTMLGVSEDIPQKIQPIQDALISKFKPRENDVIMIGSADEKRTAEFGAKTVALELLKSTILAT